MLKSMVPALVLVMDAMTGAQADTVWAFRVGSFRVVVRPHEWTNRSRSPRSRSSEAKA
jgi:hypothetical protein